MFPRLFTIPNFHFLRWEPGPFTLHTYGLLLAIAFLTGLWVASRQAKKAGLDANRVADLGVYVLIAGLLGAKLLLVDNDDCFIHTLANYARQTGAEVVTYRAGFPSELIERVAPSLILISPGPGRPRDFGVPDVVQTAVRLGVPVFGVCLGLQGIVEAFGGELGVLDYPMHGKPSTVRHRGVGVFEGLPDPFQVGRYHSLFARRETFPACLEVTAETADGVIMGVRHRELPIEAVQFHPESILTAEGDHGLKLIENAVRLGKTARTVA